MRTAGHLLRTRAAAILSRLLLVLGLLLPDLMPEPNKADVSKGPAGAFLVLAEQTPAVQRTDAAHAATVLPQNNSPAVLFATQTIQSLVYVADFAQRLTSAGTTPPLGAHLRPFAQGPPVA